MATTTNFGWPTPDNTSYVRNGASDMRTLGSAIDTSMADLKGGTTGQVLKKNTNTDMDFVWAAESGGISPTIFDAKGDLIGASAADTAARLAVGSDDQVLVADSSASTGLAWKSYGAQQVAGKNKILNGDFGIWQRGTSIATSAGLIYTTDRWLFNQTVAAACTISRQLSGLTGIRYCARVQRNAGVTAAPGMYFMYGMETAHAMALAGQAVTLSFYARAGANMSNTVLGVNLYTGTGTDENFGVGYTGGTAVISASASLTTSWQRFTFTGTIGSNATEIGMALIAGTSGTAGANDYYEITGVQLEAGSVATPFTTATGNPASELAACQRYYWDSREGGSTVQSYSSYSNSTDYLIANVRYPSTMRTTPSVTIGTASGANYVRRISTGGQLAITVTAYPGQAPTGFSGVYCAAAPFVAAVGYDFYILASAEL